MPWPDEEKMEREWAVELLEHIDEQWPVPLTFDERQDWGRAFLDLDLDYAVATYSAAKIATPQARPTLNIFLAIYSGVVEAAHADPEPENGPQWEDPVPSLPGTSTAAMGLSEIEKIRAEQGWDDPARLARANRGR